MISTLSSFNAVKSKCNIPNNFLISHQVIRKKQEPRVLIVEDNIVNQKIEVLFLNHLGYKNIDMTYSGYEAIAKCLTIKYSMVLLDIGLPDLNGFKVCQEIKKIYAYRSTPIIAISAYNKIDIEDKCMICGFNDVVSKPIFIEELKIVINRFMK